MYRIFTAAEHWMQVMSLGGTLRAKGILVPHYYTKSLTIAVVQPFSVKEGQFTRVPYPLNKPRPFLAAGPQGGSTNPVELVVKA